MENRKLSLLPIFVTVFIDLVGVGIVIPVLAHLFLDAEVNALLNFSPTRIVVPDCCLVENIDFTVKLDMLTYELSH